jgi:uracil-DNA glycosylase family 4
MARPAARQRMVPMDWDELEKTCNACRRCALHETRTHVVFGVGSREAEVLFIGEGPGEQEDRRGEPFVGRAGRLLDDMLAIIGLSRTENVYIANMVKCRPPGNRDPLNTEQEACMAYLDAQRALLAPKIVVCLGRVAAAAIIKSDLKISKEHGEWFERDGVHYMALYHPAALLRNPRLKPETFEDLKTLQRGIQTYCTRTYKNI